MDLQVVIGIVGAVAVAWFVVSTLLIYNSLQRRNVPVSFLWLRALAPRYAHLYREITRRETGRTGTLYFHWIISINVVLVAAVVLAVFALAGR